MEVRRSPASLRETHKVSQGMVFGSTPPRKERFQNNYKIIIGNLSRNVLRIMFISDTNVYQEVFIMDKIKELGQVFTPVVIVKQILDEVGFEASTYNPSQLILEPSFGEGVFLYEIIDRISEWGKLSGVSKKNIQTAMDKTIWGVEYDEELFIEVKNKLIDYARSELGLLITLPNLYRLDALDFKNYGIFDFVVGNPPYVRIHHMDAVMREKIKAYDHSTGTTDLYIIFYELGIKWLNSKGKLGYIAPNGWLKSASQAKFRAEIISNRVLKKIIDFGAKALFPGVGTYTCITILDKAAAHKDFTFSYQGNKMHYEISLNLSNLAERTSEPLYFTSNSEYSFMATLDKNKKYLFGDKFLVQNGLATLGDSIFLFDEDKIKKHNVEISFLRPVVKGSRYKGGVITTYMFFPYYEDKNGKIVGYKEEEIKKSAPNIYKYLIANKANLEKRSLDTNSLWFWYGRSQAIQDTNQEKLVFQPLIGPKQDKIKAHIVPAGILVYSGLFIIENGGGSLPLARKQIEDKDFTSYIKIVGQDKSGGYKMMSSKNVKNFPVK